MGRVLVTATPATPNGDLHVGHLAGPYLAADVFRRYRIAQGHDVSFVTSTDDHQTYLERKAEVLGATPEATAAAFGRDIRRTLGLADMEPDAFTQPVSSNVHDRYIAELFGALVDKGVVRPHDTPMLHCPACDRDLFDHDAQGRCDNCGEPCDVGICEECGRPGSALRLLEPRCTRCGATPEVRTVTRLCIDVEEHRDALEAYYSSPRSRPHTAALWAALAADRLPLVAVSNPGSWGVPCDVPGFEHHRWWCMAEMGPGYVATTQSLAAQRGEPDSWRHYWFDDDAELVQFFGYDNSYWQTVVHPTLFLASGMRAADHFVVNEFYLLDGRKFSSSKNHAVWGPDILGVVPPDVLRYYLCLTNPEEEQTDFTLAEFASTVDVDLAGDADAAVTALLSRASASSSSSASTGDGPLTARAVAGAHAVGGALEPATFSLREAIRAWRDTLLDVANRSADADPVDVGLTASVVASTAAPMMPSFGARLWDALGAPGTVGSHPWATPAGGVTVRASRAEPWFAPVDRAGLGMAPSSLR
jgi:methionyl-tRNA synthetase